MTVSRLRLWGLTRLAWIPVLLIFGWTLRAVGQECSLTILQPPSGTVVEGTTNRTAVHGTASGDLTGFLVWTNDATGGRGLVPATSPWSIDAIDLAYGINLITIEGGTETAAASVASDDAAAPAYANGWSQGSNAGEGFGPWLLQTSAPHSGYGGFFMAQGAVNLDLQPRAWGIYANSGHRAEAIRPLLRPLQVGQTIHLRFDHNLINSGGEVGVALDNSEGEAVVAFSFRPDTDSSYRLNGVETGVPATMNGLDLAFTRIDADSFSASIASLGGSVTTTAVTAVEPGRDPEVTRLRVFNLNAGPDTARNVYFDRLAILSPSPAGVLCREQISIIREAPLWPLRINEYMASNADTVPDEDGDFEDWIEIHNFGDETISLLGFGLSDSPQRPFRWTFPDVAIEAGGYLLVWASGKNREGGASEGLMREIFTGIPGTAVSDLTNHPTFPGEPSSRSILTEGFEAPANMGDNYGQRLHGWIRAPLSGSYRFWISSDDNSVLLLSSDRDPANARVIASVPGWTNPREWSKYSQQQSATISLVAGEDYYIAALHKEAVMGDHLAVRWRLPNFVTEEPIPAHRLFLNRELHTDFRISASGEPLQLTGPDGRVIDFVAGYPVPANISRGRDPAAPDQWLYFDHPTPGAPNAESGFRDLLAPPAFSVPSGMFTSGFPTEVASPDPGVVLRYTTDGSVPTENSPVYQQPLQVVSRAGVPNLISNIPTNNLPSWDYDGWREPDGEVFKITTLRARAFRENALPSPVATVSYLIAPSGPERYSLPVVSISSDASGLFDPESGIYVHGNAPGGNFMQRGPAWERLAHLTFFEADGSLAFAQDVGIRIHGGTTRNRPRKAIRIYARARYGNEAIEYAVFPDRPEVQRYRRLLLRNSGNDWGESIFRDAFMQSLMRDTAVDLQASRPAVVFLNGEYWGIHNLRDRYDVHHFDAHYGTGPEENITVLENNASYAAGNPEGVGHFQALRSFLEARGVTDPEDLAWVETQMDLENFLDYQIANIFFRNTDWPGNNVIFWRYTAESYLAGAPAGRDGRWRWALLDTDFGFGLNFNYVASAGGAFGGNDASHNTLAFALDPHQNNWPNPAWSTFMLRRLTESGQVRTRFLNRFADLLNSHLSAEHVTTTLNAFEGLYDSEMTEHIRRWRRPDHLGAWRHEMSRMRDFATARPGHLRQHLLQRYDEASGLKAITVAVDEPERGFIRVNSLDLRPGLPGVSPTVYPWTGFYFQGVPVEVEAVPHPGFVFSGWMHDPSAPASLTVTNGASLVATFAEAPPYRLFHYWSFNAPADLLAPTFTVGNGHLEVEPGPETEVTHGTGQDFAGENSRLGEEAGAHLRVNNPLGATITWQIPTTGFEDIVVAYETRRSGQGAEIQRVSYTTDGLSFHPLATIITANAAPSLERFDFSEISGASDNPLFALAISFEAGNGGSTGNARFDNFTVEGRPLDSANQPPELVAPIVFRELIEQGQPLMLDLNRIFTDADGDTLTFTATSTDPAVSLVSVQGNLLTVLPLRRGEASISLTASDGVFAPASHDFGVLVYPAAHALAEGIFTFTSWSPGEPEGAYPDYMIFLQGETIDTELNTPLLRAYHIPRDDYAPADAATIGFPYNNTARTRINGLGENGISFVNTGRGRDLGAALAAVDTRGVDHVTIDWLAGTVTPNSRTYALRLQYRIGIDGPFLDLLDDLGSPVEYVREGAAGAERSMPTLALPAEALGAEYVQLLWRYYRVSGTSGARAELRLDDIRVAAGAEYHEVVALALPTHGGTVTGAGLHPAGATIDVTATPETFFTFSHWTGDVPEGRTEENPLSLNVGSSRSIIAHFAAEVTDNTGTPLWWLASYGLTDPSFAEAALRDKDGDGFAAWQEYVAGTDPTDPSSALRVRPQRDGAVLTLRFRSTSARLYTLQTSSNLITWKNVPDQGPKPGLDGDDSFAVSPPAENAFYRLKVQIP